jgi:hypothetical protein
VPLAHPLTHAYGLPVSPLVAAVLAVALVLIAAFGWPEADRRGPGRPTRELASWAGSLSPVQVLTRLAFVILLGLAVAAGRLGVDDQLENLAPALVVGAAWPLVVAMSVVVGPVWRWIDPWDAIARVVLRDAPGRRPGHVWPAAAVAVPWVWYLSAYDESLDPRSVGAAVGVYTLFTVAGCLAFGRVRWLSSGEPFGIVLSWMALLPRRGLAGWDPPRGAEALLGVFAGGVLFGAVRRSAPLWGRFDAGDRRMLVAAAGLLALSAATAALFTGAAVGARRLGAPGAVAVAAVPAVAAIAVAVAMERNRLFTSVQLLPGLLGDPFGRGWDLLGRAGAGLDPDPLGTTGLLVAQLAVLVMGYAAGAVVHARRARRRARTPGAVALAVLAGASTVVLVSH